VRAATRAAGTVLVLDEVMTSRLSVSGAQGLLGLAPDMTTLGKYLAGGLTFGAFGGSADLMAAFDPDAGGLSHGGTFNNNAFTMAAGAAVHGIVTADGWLDALTGRGDSLRARLTEVFDASPLQFSVTGWGSLCAVHPVDGPVVAPADLAGADDRWRQLFFHDILDAGFYLAPRGYLALSAAVTDEDLDQFVDAVAAFCERHRAIS
jgi:glutamate-1-semialdehyde 2,1-aminomutase